MFPILSRMSVRPIHKEVVEGALKSAELGNSASNLRDLEVMITVDGNMLVSEEKSLFILVLL
jgi:hypothetical protein